MYKCKFCGKILKAANTLVLHQNNCLANPVVRDSIFECKFCGKFCKNKNSLCNHERLCANNPERDLTTFEKYGLFANFDKTGKPAWNRGLTKDTDARVKAYANTLHMAYTNGTLIPVQTGKPLAPETKEKIRLSMLRVCSTKTSSLCGKGKRGKYNGIYCQSSWELAYVIYCIEHNINFKRNNIGFNYSFGGKMRTYFPDFYLPDTDTFVEIKGYYDKKTQAKEQQFTGNLLVLRKKDMQPYLFYVENKYGKDFTYLYDI